MAKKGLPAIHPGAFLSETLEELRRLPGGIRARPWGVADADFARDQGGASGDG